MIVASLFGTALIGPSSLIGSDNKYLIYAGGIVFGLVNLIAYALTLVMIKEEIQIEFAHWSKEKLTKTS